MRNKSLIIGGVLVLIAAIVVGSTAFTVRETEQVIVLRFGEAQRLITEPGLNFKVPIFDNATYYDNRVLDFDAERQEIPTQDQKQLVVDAYARYRIVDPLLFFQAVRTEFRARERISALINNALRNTLGEVKLDVVLTPKRAELVSNLTGVVAAEAKGFGVDIVDVRIKRIDLPESNSQAIFNRMRSQREQAARLIRAEGEAAGRRIRADGDKQQRVIIAEAEKTAEITRGSGDAEAERIYHNAYSKDAEFFDFWRTLQAAKRGLKGDRTSYVGPANPDLLRFFRDQPRVQEGLKELDSGN